MERALHHADNFLLQMLQEFHVAIARTLRVNKLQQVTTHGAKRTYPSFIVRLIPMLCNYNAR